MSDNFYLDNEDLQFRLEQLNLEEAVAIKEKGYREAAEYPTAPRNYADAKDNYAIVLEVLGEICAERIAPRAAEADEEGAHFEDGVVSYTAATQDALAALKQAELFGVMLPRDVGGLNLPESIYQMMVEMIARAESGFMTVVGLQEIASMIDEYADQETRMRVLPKFSRGEVSGAMVLTEADAGSDLGAVATRATLDEATGKWYLNGVKRFITNGLADVSVVLARSEPGTTDARGLSMFLVEKDETVKIRRIENKMGIHSSPTCEIQYTNTPATLIGKRRFGLMRYAMNLMNGARLAVGAQAMGIAEAAYREADRYSRERVQFGKPIRVLPAVARLLMSMRCDVEATRALLAETSTWVDLWKAYEHSVEGDEVDAATRARHKQCAAMAETLTPMVKYCATEMANRVAYQSMQVHGGVGYMKEFNVERLYRDARITNIYEGTSQLQVVAAIGKLLNHNLDPLLDEWSAASYPDDMAAEKNLLVELTALYRKAVDVLKAEDDRAKVDYYACDLVDCAVWLVTSWLLLRDTSVKDAKKPVARTYMAAVAPRLRASAEVVIGTNPTPLESIPALLG
jgi:alkylation response protein AidB-like acyl-CoA dehydrogenase